MALVRQRVSRNGMMSLCAVQRQRRHYRLSGRRDIVLSRREVSDLHLYNNAFKPTSRSHNSPRQFISMLQESYQKGDELDLIYRVKCFV